MFLNKENIMKSVFCDTVVPSKFDSRSSFILVGTKELLNYMFIN